MSNPVAIVTGASQGIGQATALRLARDFSGVVLTARNESELQKTANGVRSAGAERAERGASQALVGLSGPPSVIATLTPHKLGDYWTRV